MTDTQRQTDIHRSVASTALAGTASLARVTNKNEAGIAGGRQVGGGGIEQA